MSPGFAGDLATQLPLTREPGTVGEPSVSDFFRWQMPNLVWEFERNFDQLPALGGSLRIYRGVATMFFPAYIAVGQKLDEATVELVAIELH